MRIVIADDHPIVLNALHEMLSRARHEVLGSARAGDDALALIRANGPDVAILDVTMPGKTGVEILRALRENGDPTRVVLLTGTLNDLLLVEAIQLGVDGIVLKESATDMLLRCLDHLARGEQWIDREVMARGLQALSHTSDEPRMTRREREILELVARGMRNREIGAELGMSEGTVKAHLSNIFAKLGVTSRTELLIRARDLHLI